jgi:hypothetical protein
MENLVIHPALAFIVSSSSELLALPHSTTPPNRAAHAADDTGFLVTLSSSPGNDTILYLQPSLGDLW